MKFNQQIILKHEHGITAQWMSDDYTNMAIVTYQQDNNKWVLVNCSGPWTGLSEDGKSLLINDKFESERLKVSGDATIILTCLNATIGGAEALDNVWRGQKSGF